MANPVTPSPTALTVPASSAPGENGSGGLNWYLSSMISVSKKFSAAAATETTTCPGAATGASTSFTTSASGGPNFSHNTALTSGLHLFAHGLADYHRLAAAPNPRGSWCAAPEGVQRVVAEYAADIRWIPS